MIISAPLLATFDRPADTNAYTARDAISDSTSTPTVKKVTLSATGLATSVWLIEARLRVNLATFLPRIRLHLFNAAPAGVNDNAAMAVAWANDRSKHIGAIDLAALQAVTGMARGDWRETPKGLYLPTGELWFIPEALDAGTPSSGMTIETLFSFDDGR